jgi:hypothetical protein
MYSRETAVYFTVLEVIANMIRKNIKGELPFLLTNIGRWWNKQIEIDLVGFSIKIMNIFSGNVNGQQKR